MWGNADANKPTARPVVRKDGASGCVQKMMMKMLSDAVPGLRVYGASCHYFSVRSFCLHAQRAVLHQEGPRAAPVGHVC